MHKKLKHVIHPNRYFIWTIILMAIIVGLLQVAIYSTILSFNNLSVFAELKTKRTYVDVKSGFSVRYPRDWQIEKDGSGNVVFENPANLQESLSVTSATLDTEGIIRHSISVKTEKDIAKENLKIALIKAGSTKDGSDIDIAIIKTSKKLFYISGHSNLLETFARNFKAQ
jgi:hypothetical protein